MLDVRGHKFLLSAWDLMFGALPQTQIIKSCWALSSTSGFLTIFLVLVCFQNLQPPHEQVCSPAKLLFGQKYGAKKKAPSWQDQCLDAPRGCTALLGKGGSGYSLEAAPALGGIPVLSC